MRGVRLSELAILTRVLTPGLIILILLVVIHGA